MAMMCTQGCQHILADDFVNWLGLARPGEQIVYAVGFLSVAVHRADLNEDPDGPKLEAVQKATWKAHERGNVHLIQRRLGPESFDYRAVKARCGFGAAPAGAARLEDLPNVTRGRAGRRSPSSSRRIRALEVELGWGHPCSKTCSPRQVPFTAYK